MYERSELTADKVADVVSQKRVGNLLDLGCGPGSYTAAILKKDKTAIATLMDRAVAIKVARKYIKLNLYITVYTLLVGIFLMMNLGRDTIQSSCLILFISTTLKKIKLYLKNK